MTWGRRWLSILLLFGGSVQAAPLAAEACDTVKAFGPVEAVAYIRRAVRDHPIVVLAEGGHTAAEPHELLRRVLSDPGIMRSVDVIIVEFATALQQPVLDAYVGGEDVAPDELSRVWRDTSTSPVAPWDSPLYAELLRVIREANAALPAEDRVRVLAGDPPFDWTSVHTRSDFERVIQPRDPFVAGVAMQQAFELGRKVLIVFGGAHLPKVPVGAPDDMRNSLTYGILARHPGSVKAIGFLNPENLGIADRVAEFSKGFVYPTDEHWVGEIEAHRFFPNVYSRVTDPVTGEVTWQELPLYSGRQVRDLFDALVYIGPSSGWHTVPPSIDADRDGAYLAELNRRSLLRLGRPYGSGR
jgi:hypothetical protein